MSDSQYDKPTTRRQADKNIAKIQQHQENLRSQGRTADAAEWNQDLTEQREAREAIREQRESRFQQTLKQITGDR